MFRIGCHLSTSRGFMGMGRDAESIGANTFQFFTRNPRGGAAKDINPKDVSDFLAFCSEKDIGSILAHAPYTLNPCSDKESTREFARNTLEDDIKRMEYVPGNCYNMHPGSHVGQGVDKGISMIAEILNEVMTPKMNTTLLLETMSGKGSEIGSTFEEIASIIDLLEVKEKVGVCLDTCHVSDAGYDVIGDFDGVLDEFDSIIGLGRLKAIHLNDSLNPRGAAKDRHARIGDGEIGLEAICSVINNPRTRDLPFYLETPNELPGYAAEIALLKKCRI